MYYLCAIVIFYLSFSSFADNANEETVIRITGYTPWAWNAPTRAARRSFEYFLENQRDPVSGELWREKIQLAADNPLHFPGFSLKLLNFAGGTGEEVITSGEEGLPKFFQYRDQRFLMPLNQFIWEIRKDADGKPIRKEDNSWDYVLDEKGEKKIIWKDWEKIPDGYKSMVIQGDDVLGLPLSMKSSGLIYRKDIFRQAGLDPERLPATWDELFEYALKISALSTSDSRKFGFLLEDYCAVLYTLCEGGDIARKYKVYNGEKIYALPGEPLDKAADGSDISSLKLNWEALYDSPEYINAVKFLRKMALTRWIITPSRKPVVVWLPDTEEQAKIYDEELGGEGKWLGSPLSNTSKLVFPKKEFAPEEIQKGLVYCQVAGGSSQSSEKWYELFFSTEARLGMAIRPASVLEQFGHVNPEQWAFGSIPSGKVGAFSRVSGRVGGLNVSLTSNPERARYAWAVLSFMAGSEFLRQQVRTYVNEGLAAALPPELLVSEGFSTVAEEIPLPLKQYWAQLKHTTLPEISAKNFASLSSLYLAPVLKKAVSEENYDFISGLKDANKQIQARLDFDAKIYQSLIYRIMFSVAVFGIFLFIAVFSWKAFRALSEHYAGSTNELSVGLVKKSNRSAYVLLFPALALISVFSYYPIFAALPIAFQDYYVTGQREWVGLANFIEVFRNPDTWYSLLRSFYYLSFSITLGFIAPIVIAILLSEIRMFQYFFRTSYYLPAVISGIIMLVLWQKFLEPTPSGLVNQLLFNFVNFYNSIVPSFMKVPKFEALDFLKSPMLGIPCVVFIHIWGHAGPGTLIYLAALKSIPEDLYEAAELEGAGWYMRFRHITLSYLSPLLLINFIGAVISSFQKSGEILPLAGNFPATRTFAVQIWSEAFAFCNFGVATALSWLMASLLIGFTIWNLKVLRKVEFRKASAE